MCFRMSPPYGGMRLTGALEGRRSRFPVSAVSLPLVAREATRPQGLATQVFPALTAVLAELFHSACPRLEGHLALAPQSRAMALAHFPRGPLLPDCGNRPPGRRGPLGLPGKAEAGALGYPLVAAAAEVPVGAAGRVVDQAQAVAQAFRWSHQVVQSF